MRGTNNGISRRQRTPRRPYRSWMRDALPIPPTTTAQRYRKQTAPLQDLNMLVGTSEEEAASSSKVDVKEMQDVSMNSSAHTEDVMEGNRSPSGSRRPSTSISGSRRSSTSISDHQMDSNSESSSSTSSSRSSSPASINELSSELSDNDAAAGDNTQNTFFMGGKKFHHLENEVYLNARRSKFDVMLLIWAFSFRHSLTAAATEDLSKLVNCILGNEFIPSTKYMYKEVFGSINYSFHFYCPHCSCYIKEMLKSERKNFCILRCPICQRESSTSDLNDGHFFVTLPVKDQLSFFLQNTPNILDHLLYRWNRKEADETVITDIFDGLLYKNLVKNGGVLAEQYSLSLSFSTDGAVLFPGSKNTLWPIHFRLNELPPSCRFDQENSLLAGLWFGKHEPDMSMFLAPFLKQARQLYKTGVDWTAPSGELINSRVVLFASVLDSKAKPIVQQINQFNDYYGCGYCYHPGVVVAGNKHVKYPLNDKVCLLDDFGLSYTVDGIDRVSKEEKVFHVTDRNNKDCRKEMTLAETLRREDRIGESKSVHDYKGVKGKSVFWFLAYFDVVYGFAIDYMHGVLLGVVRSVCFLWLESPITMPYSIKDKENVINERLLGICPPASISRRPRSISDRAHWRANEWRSWLLYYSLPCLKGILPAAYLKHHCLLVSSSFLLLKERISISDLEKAAWFLVEYVVEFQKLYGPSHMFFNVHLLLHMSKMVKMMGPWWCYSSFSFEPGNGVLLKLVKGVRGAANQVAEKYSVCRIVPHVIQLYNVSDKVILYCTDLMCYRIVSDTCKVNSHTMLGAPKSIELSDDERQAFTRAGYPPTTLTYERMIKDRIKFNAKCYSRPGTKSDDSLARLANGKYVIIQRILLLPDKHVPLQRVALVVAQDVHVECNESVVSHRNGANASHIKVCSSLPYGGYHVLDAEQIISKSILMRVGNETYITDFPNYFEKD